jgi:hypothetical protein
VCASLLILREDLVVRRGFVSKPMVCCTNTACNKKAAVSDPNASDSMTLNTESVSGMRELKSFCGSCPAKTSMECAREKRGRGKAMEEGNRRRGS